MTVEASDRGGMSTIASACTVYNDIAQNRPDLLHVLTKPDWPFDTYVQIWAPNRFSNIDI